MTSFPALRTRRLPLRNTIFPAVSTAACSKRPRISLSTPVLDSSLVMFLTTKVGIASGGSAEVRTYSRRRPHAQPSTSGREWVALPAQRWGGAPRCQVLKYPPRQDTEPRQGCRLRNIRSHQGSVRLTAPHPTSHLCSTLLCTCHPFSSCVRS